MPIKLPYVLDYTVQVDVAAAPEAVARTVTDPHRYGLWQPEFHGATVVSGRPGRPGLVCRLRFGQEDGEELEMTEEVIEADLPHREVTRYTWGAVRNIVDNRFVTLPEGKTRWSAHHIFEIDDVELATLAKDHPLLFRDATREAMHNLADHFAARTGASELSFVRATSIEDLEEIERRQLESS